MTKASLISVQGGKLVHSARKLTAASLSGNTRRGYQERGGDLSALSDSDPAADLTRLFDEGVAPASAQMMTASGRFVARTRPPAGWDAPWPLSDRVMAGLKGIFSGHSLWIGSAQSLAASGASLVEMQTAGRGSSPAMPGHYARGATRRPGGRCPSPLQRVISGDICELGGRQRIQETHVSEHSGERAPHGEDGCRIFHCSAGANSVEWCLPWIVGRDRAPLSPNLSKRPPLGPPPRRLRILPSEVLHDPGK